METLYGWIAELHDAAGQPSVRTIETAVGICRTTVADAIAGRNNPSLQSVTAVATYLARRLPKSPENSANSVAIKARRLYAKEQLRLADTRTDHRKRPGRRPSAGPSVFLLLHLSGEHLVVHGAASDADEAKERADLIKGVAVELPVAFDFRPQNEQEDPS